MATPSQRLELEWRRKPVLRRLYEDYYRRIEASMAAGPGPVLEVGGGIGNLKSHRPDVLSLDIIPLPGIDVAGDAQALPFGDAAFANIVGVDVLHHLEYPLLFLKEAARLLRPGGRLVLLEPGITPLSHVFYRFFHEEDVDMSADPFVVGVPDPRRDPFLSNQAVPTLMFCRQGVRLPAAVPGLRLVRADWLSLLAYPLSGGFRPWSLAPATWVPGILRLEARLLPMLGRWAAFRLLAVLEKTA